jgi:hypothetical protein
MTTTLDIYRERRDTLLARITDDLAMDERFIAGWLTGCYARGDADALNDIDITIAVADPESEVLCRRLEQVSSQTSSERYSLFNLFGAPVLIHENNNNAPEGGTFTFVLYSESALMIDWALIPQSKAKRPSQSILLFEKVNIPVTPPLEPEALEQSKKELSEIWAFFWMMTAITIKYMIRSDAVFVTEWIEHLYNLQQEIERRLDRKPWQYNRGSLTSLQPSREDQISSIRQLCNCMLKIKDRVSEFIGAEPLTPMTEIENLFTLAQNANPQSKIVNPKS